MSPTKTIINLDATSLGHASCLLDYKRSIIDGYKQNPSSAIVYGTAVHSFIDAMYNNGGNFKLAREVAQKSFSVKKSPASKSKSYLEDPRHLDTVCISVWRDFIEQDSLFSLLTIPKKCKICGGKKFIDTGYMQSCPQCNETGIVNGPATEINFRILFYEDDFIQVYLCGTIDKLGKIQGGCYSIGDWKTTSSWNTDEYFVQYDLSRQLRIYTLAMKMMARLEPDSILGKIGASKMGAFIDAIFLNTDPNKVVCERSTGYSYSDKELDEFEGMLKKFCLTLSTAVSMNEWPKQGILNGTCVRQFGKCPFWNVCKAPGHIAELVLKRDFFIKSYNPLNFNGEE